MVFEKRMSENQIINEGSLTLPSDWLRKCPFGAIFIYSHAVMVLQNEFGKLRQAKETCNSLLSLLVSPLSILLT